MDIDITSAVPLYMQIVLGIKAERLTGRWRTGDRIPPVRELASSLRINPNTVAKAYKILQDEGVLESRPGGGNFIAPQEDEVLRRERESRLEEEIVNLLAKTDQLGIPRAEVAARLSTIIERETGK